MKQYNLEVHIEGTYGGSLTFNIKAIANSEEQAIENVKAMFKDVKVQSVWISLEKREVGN